MGQLKVELFGNLILRPLDDLTVELDQFAANCTDEMVVMLVIVMMLIASTPISEALFTRQSALAEELQRPVDGGVPNRWILLLDEMVEILGAEMALCLEKDKQNQLPLGGLLQSRPPDMLKKYLFLLNEFGHGINFNPANITTIEPSGKQSSPGHHLVTAQLAAGRSGPWPERLEAAQDCREI